jgi:hypothetical protein
MLVLNNNDLIQIGKELERMGCTWEGSNIKNWISIDVPKEIPYSPVKNYLDEGEKNDRWSYREACLAH